MRNIPVCGALLGLAANVAYSDELASQLLVQTEVATVNIAPQPPGVRLLELPGIDLTVLVDARCQNASRPESVSINVADTRLTLTAEELTKPEVLERTMRVPASQLAPVAVNNFCVAGNDDANAATILRVPEALGAQLSLKCADDLGQSIFYQTEALELTLSCTKPNDN